MPWMHAKLTLAVVVIALHHVIGARVRRISKETPTLAVVSGPLGWRLWCVPLARSCWASPNPSRRSDTPTSDASAMPRECRPSKARGRLVDEEGRFAEVKGRSADWNCGVDG